MRLLPRKGFNFGRYHGYCSEGLDFRERICAGVLSAYVFGEARQEKEQCGEKLGAALNDVAPERLKRLLPLPKCYQIRSLEASSQKKALFIISYISCCIYHKYIVEC
nr:hypothetical protein [Tanacetum cinerariifolium]